MMADDACESCKFFELSETSAGICRRFPPSPFPTSPAQVTTFWPMVQVDHWCGEWRTRLYVARSLPQAPQERMQ